MEYKLGRLVASLSTIALPIVCWFTPNIVEWQLGIPTTNTDGAKRVALLVHLWAVQIGVSIIIGFVWPIPRKTKDMGQQEVLDLDRKLLSSWWGRSFYLAFMMGLIGSYLLTFYSFPFAWWVPLMLTIFGLVQMSVIGLMFGTLLHEQR